MILQLAEDLGMRTVAEGAENVQQVEILQAMGCRLIQGYYFSQPLPAPQLQELIRNDFVVPPSVANPKPPAYAGSGPGDESVVGSTARVEVRTRIE